MLHIVPYSGGGEGDSMQPLLNYFDLLFVGVRVREANLCVGRTEV